MAEHQTGQLLLNPGIVSERVAVLQPINLRFGYAEGLTVQSNGLRRRVGLGDGSDVELRFLVNFHSEGLCDAIDGVVGHASVIV